MGRITGGEVPASSSSPARRADSRNGCSYTGVALHGRQKRGGGGSIIAVSRVDISPLTIGAVTIERIASATVSRAVRLGIPAAFRGLAASKISLPAAPSQDGAVAAAITGRSARR